jgi:hypothetical protein
MEYLLIAAAVASVVSLSIDLYSKKKVTVISYFLLMLSLVASLITQLIIAEWKIGVGSVTMMVSIVCLLTVFKKSN